MKRGNFYMKLTTAVLFLAVVGYVGVYIYNATQNTYVTAAAYGFTVEDSVAAQGFVVRTEAVIEGAGSEVLPIVSEGEKVASGQTVAVEYTGSAALKIAGEIRELRLRISHYLEMGDASTAGYESVLELSKVLHNGNMSKFDDAAMKVEANVFSGDNTSKEELPHLQARLATLESQSVGVLPVRAPVSGTYSQIIDGFEHVKPSKLADIKPSAFVELFDAPSGARGHAGKLITEFKWYYAAVMDASDAVRLTQGKHITLQFLGSYYTSIEMMVENIGRREGNLCVVLFSSSRGIHNVTKLRSLNAEVIIGEIAGVRVPKEAIRLDDDGATFVFLQTGVRAERVNVEILYEFADGYLLRDGTESGTPLRSGSTVIVKANNLFDGKVVG